jgi:hypothetical protein
VKRLSARYFWIGGADQNIRSIGVDAPPPSQSSVKVELLGRLNGVWQRVTGSLENRLFCRTVQAEAYEELVLIYANTSMEDDWNAPEEEQPRVITSNIGCRFSGTGGWEASLFQDHGLITAQADSQASSNFTLEYDPNTPASSDGYVRFVGTSGSASGRYTETINHRILSVPECTATASGSEAIAPQGKATVEMSINMFGEAKDRRSISGGGDFSDTYPLSKDCAIEPKPDPRTGLPSFFDPTSGKVDPVGKYSGSYDNPLLKAPDFIRIRWTLEPA